MPRHRDDLPIPALGTLVALAACVPLLFLWALQAISGRWLLRIARKYWDPR